MIWIRVAHPQMKIAMLQEWEIGLRRGRAGSTRNRKWAMPTVQVRSTLTP